MCAAAWAARTRARSPARPAAARARPPGPIRAQYRDLCQPITAHLVLGVGQQPRHGLGLAACALEHRAHAEPLHGARLRHPGLGPGLLHRQRLEAGHQVLALVRGHNLRHDVCCLAMLFSCQMYFLYRQIFFLYTNIFFSLPDNIFGSKKYFVKICSACAGLCAVLGAGTVRIQTGRFINICTIGFLSPLCDQYFNGFC